jgi:O-antigen/teichoic acid export membrane protein
MPQALIAQMNQQAPRFVIKLLFAASVLGTYTVCLRVLMAPVLILNNALRCVLLQRISAARETPGQARRIVAMLSWRLFFLMLPFCLVFAIWADEIFGLLLGPQWTSAGKYARLLLPMVLAHGVVGSIRIGFQALEAQFAIFCMDLVSLAITVLALYAGFAFGSATIGILAYSLATAAMYAVNLAVIFYVLDPQPTGAAPAS